MADQELRFEPAESEMSLDIQVEVFELRSGVCGGGGRIWESLVSVSVVL